MAVPVTAAPRGMFVEELEINDYPAVARLRASARDLKAGIENRTGSKIIVKGQYVAPKHKPPAGARKLFVEISAPTKAAAEQAKHELLSAIEEVAIATLKLPFNSQKKLT